MWSIWKKSSEEPPPKDRCILSYNVNCDVQTVVEWIDGWDGFAWYYSETHFWKEIDYWHELPVNPSSPFATDPISQASKKIMDDRNKIIDLFCSTFLLAQEPKTVQELKDMFPLIELECKMGESMSQTFRVKLRGS